jgi:cell division protein ZapA (FtsZ GTPase activity inhibitor)
MEEKDYLITVNIIIADRPYPVKIKRSEEEKVRSAAKLINDRVKDFQLNYEGKDKQDFLAMVSLQVVLDSIQNQATALDPNIIHTLDEIDTLLSTTH